MNTPIINTSLVSRLIKIQFPQWAELPVTSVEIDGWDNRSFHLGNDMSARLPSAERYVAQVEKEHRWLPILARHLPFPIPSPLAMGEPGEGYPWNWSIYRWIEGDNATIERIGNLPQFATTLARFLEALHKISPVDGPSPERHNFFRGGPLATYDAETRDAISSLRGEVDEDAAIGVWEAALNSQWKGEPVWIHGDFTASNMLVKDSELCGVIDFGCSGVGDPSCDLTIAWTFLSGESRKVFREAMPLDEATWARARGWAVWKALITLDQNIGKAPLRAEEARRVVNEVLSEYSSI